MDHRHRLVMQCYRPSTFFDPRKWDGFVKRPQERRARFDRLTVTGPELVEGRDEAQRSIRTFYEAVKFEMIDGGSGSDAGPKPIAPIFNFAGRGGIGKA